jgi:citronellol/citronellal dehydrogenase
MPSRIFADELLDGQVVVVTGGGSAPGRATARELTACGATVVLAGHAREPLEETAALCVGGRCEPVECDVREEEQVAGLVDAALERHGAVHTLVNNPGEQAADVASNFEQAVRLSLEGTWLVTHAVATKTMIPAGGGKVISVTPAPDIPQAGTAQSAARAAIETMTRTLAIEWARFAIRLVAIADERFDAEVAWLAAYLASPAGNYHSGSMITLGAAGGPLAGERRLEP